MAAAAIAADAGPCHSSSVSAETTAPYDSAVERNSAATPFHAEAAATIEAGPAPAYIRDEFTSGGSIEKSNVIVHSARYTAAMVSPVSTTA
jgi:hypothetical protein